MTKERQLAFFEGKPPSSWKENLLLPLESDDLRAFEEADGNELAEKMKAPHSSSALCVNFFLYWKRQALPEFTEMFALKVFGESVDTRAGCSLRFESKHRFGSTAARKLIRGRAGNIDLEVRIGQTHAVLTESKFTETFSRDVREISEVNRERYCQAFSRVFLCDAAALLDGRNETKYRQLAQRLLYTVDNEDSAFRDIPNRRMLFLYYDHAGFDRDLLRFPEVVRREHRNAIVLLSYQELYELIRRRFDGPEHRSYFDYMSRRYF